VYCVLCNYNITHYTLHICQPGLHVAVGSITRRISNDSSGTVYFLTQVVAHYTLRLDTFSEKQLETVLLFVCVICDQSNFYDYILNFEYENVMHIRC